MIEGQTGVTWEDWVALAEACERLGFEALFRSDHYGPLESPATGGSLDAWSTICGLASVTSTVRLGTLVSPVTFRHPSVRAKSAVTADHISGGRVEVGIGRGWNEDEHRRHGFAFPPLRTRMDQMAEQLEIISGAWAPGPFSFRGEHWAVEDLDAQPKPLQQPHPTLVMGGAARAPAAPLAAPFASENNVSPVPPPPAAAAPGRPAAPPGGAGGAGGGRGAPCREAGREPADLGFSLMHGFVIGADAAEVGRRADRLAEQRGAPVDLGEWLAGTPEEMVAQLREYEAAGVQRVMLQHLLFRDTDALELIAREVMPAMAG